MAARPDLKVDKGVELSPESKALAEKELRETPERVREALERLRELLKENPDLYYGDDDEVFTIFLRTCKWYPESALALMRRHAEFKRDYGAPLAGLRPAHVKELFLNHSIANVLKHRDHKNRRISIVNNGGVWDPKKVTVDDIFKMFYLIHVVALQETESQVHGGVMIMDYHNMGWSQATAVTPSASRRQLTFLQDALAARLKEVHVIRQPMIFNVVWNLCKPFVREKLRNRMFFHGSKMSSLHKHIPPSHLPADYGGTLPAIDYGSADWYPVLEENTAFVETWDTFGFAKKT